MGDAENASDDGRDVVDRLGDMRQRIELADSSVQRALREQPKTVAAAELFRAFGPELRLIRRLDDDELSPESIRAGSLSPEVESQAEQLEGHRADIDRIQRQARSVVDEAVRIAIRRLPGEIAGLAVRRELGDAGKDIADAMHTEPTSRVAMVRAAARRTLPELDISERELATRIESWLALAREVDEERTERAGAWVPYVIEGDIEANTGSDDLDLLILAAPRSRVDPDHQVIGLPRALGRELGIEPHTRSVAGSHLQATKMVRHTATELRAALKNEAR